MLRAVTRLLLLLAAMVLAAPALAASCWDHNGSVMRLKASGNERAFFYESPRSGLWDVGVRPGTLLFNGVKTGNWYSGTARVFSAGCAPLEYFVEGPVRPDQLQVTVTGERAVYSQCVFTGRYTTDVLVFTYLRDCWAGRAEPPGGPRFRRHQRAHASVAEVVLDGARRAIHLNGDGCPPDGPLGRQERCRVSGGS